MKITEKLLHIILFDNIITSVTVINPTLYTQFAVYGMFRFLYISFPLSASLSLSLFFLFLSVYISLDLIISCTEKEVFLSKISKYQCNKISILKNRLISHTQRALALWKIYQKKYKKNWIVYEKCWSKVCSRYKGL